MLTGVILLSFLSINLGYLRPLKGLKGQHTKVLFNTKKDSEIFYPFTSQQLSTATSEQSPLASLLSDETNRLSRELLRAAPALSALAVMGTAGNADAADSITAPLQGFELYSR